MFFGVSFFGEKEFLLMDEDGAVAVAIDLD